MRAFDRNFPHSIDHLAHVLYTNNARPNSFEAPKSEDTKSESKDTELPDSFVRGKENNQTNATVYFLISNPYG